MNRNQLFRRRAAALAAACLVSASAVSAEWYDAKTGVPPI